MRGPRGGPGHRDPSDADSLRGDAAGRHPGHHTGAGAARPGVGRLLRGHAAGGAGGDGAQAGEHPGADRGARAQGRQAPHAHPRRRLHADAFGARGRGAGPDRARRDRQAARQPAQPRARPGLPRGVSSSSRRTGGLARPQARARGRRPAPGGARGRGVPRRARHLAAGDRAARPDAEAAQGRRSARCQAATEAASWISFSATIRSTSATGNRRAIRPCSVCSSARSPGDSSVARHTSTAWLEMP